MEDELKLVFEAEERSKQILARAQREASRLRAEGVSEAERLIERAREDAQKQCEDLISRRISEAAELGKQLTSEYEGRIERMRQNAAARMKAAVDLILRSVVEEG